MPALAARAAGTRLTAVAKQSSSPGSPSRTASYSRNFDVEAELGDLSGGGSSGSANAGLPDAQTLRGDVKKLQDRLKNMDKNLLNPSSRLMQVWDFCTLSALAFTATVTPYETCMMWKEVKFADGVAEWLTVSALPRSDLRPPLCRLTAIATPRISPLLAAALCP